MWTKIAAVHFQPLTRALVLELNARVIAIGWCPVKRPEEVSHCNIWSLAPSLLLYPCAHDIKNFFFSMAGPVVSYCKLWPVLWYSWPLRNHNCIVYFREEFSTTGLSLLVVQATRWCSWMTHLYKSGDFRSGFTDL
jgi:hypothetical protein